MGNYKALVIPVDGPVQEIELTGSDDLTALQAAVGGLIQALPLPDFIGDNDKATVYINEDGKYTCVNEDGSPQFNGRATDFMVPGIGLFWGDYISGPMVVAGFNARKGETDVLPEAVERRVRLVEREAGR